MTIQEAAEKIYPSKEWEQKWRDSFIDDVKLYISLMKAEGYELVKVEGEGDDGILLDLMTKYWAG
jgi:hypothetical protein